MKNFKTEVDELAYPLYDFASSELTHTYTVFTSEPNNKYRTPEVIKDKNFGVLHFDFSLNEVHEKIHGENNIVLTQITQKY